MQDVVPIQDLNLPYAGAGCVVQQKRAVAFKPSARLIYPPVLRNDFIRDADIVAFVGLGDGGAGIGC